MKKFYVLILFIIFAIFIVACSLESNDTNEEVKRTGTSYCVHDYVDPETGVHYLIYQGGYQGGITVRYNADGTIMVDPVE